MAQFPVLPIFTDAFISDTINLNAAQTGAYFMLLMCAWRSSDCMIPDDDKILAKYARMDLRTWINNKDIVLSFWKKDQETQKWYQGRLLDERNYAEYKRSKNSEAGKASALKRHNTYSTSVQRNSNTNSTNPTLPYPEDSFKVKNGNGFKEATPRKVSPPVNGSISRKNKEKPLIHLYPGKPNWETYYEAHIQRHGEPPELNKWGGVWYPLLL